MTLAVRCLLLASLICAGLAATGCGHPASRAECEEIIERMMRLRAQEKSIDESGLEEKIEDAKEDLVKECEGKRITDSFMECVRNAKTADEIRDC